MKENQIDPSKVIASLSNQISNQALIIAEREALLQEVGQELHEVKKELDEVRSEQINAMNKAE